MQYRLTSHTAACALLVSLVALLGLTGCGLSAGGVANESARSDLVRTLDFGPFQSALDELDEGRLADLDRIVTETNMVGLRAMVEAGDVTARELTLTYVARIRDFDGPLRSVGELNPDALVEADRLDELLASGQGTGRLHGMPILLKDNIATGDQMHNTAGAAALADHVSPRDSFLAAQLRSEGAVILGKTNLSEWAFYMSSQAPSGYSALGGQVVNPYGAGLDVSGSSSGSAVAASVDFAAATIGTETTGSVVAPAAANGVAGMRPTLGLVSGDLIIPITSSLDSAGPMAKDVASLAMLLTAMSAEDSNDPNRDLAGASRNVDFARGLADASLVGLTVGVPDITVPAEGDPRRQVVDETIRALESAGATVVSVEIDTVGVQALAGDQLNLFNGSMRRDVNAYLTATDAPMATLADVIEFNERDLESRAPFGQDFLIAAQQDTTDPQDHAALGANLRTIAQRTIETAAAVDDADVLLSLDHTFSLLYALAGTPAVTVPVGVDGTGQPHGATFVGITPGSDADVLGVAYAFEQATGWRTAPEIAGSPP